MMQRNAMLLCAGLALSSCSSVEVPRESWWRLDIPVAGLSANSRDACVLRVQDLQGGFAAGRGQAGNLLLREQAREDLEHRGFVVDQQHIGHGSNLTGRAREAGT